jgi:hypothetical protein
LNIEFNEEHNLQRFIFERGMPSETLMGVGFWSRLKQLGVRLSEWPGTTKNQLGINHTQGGTLSRHHGFNVLGVLIFS